MKPDHRNERHLAAASPLHSAILAALASHSVSWADEAFTLEQDTGYRGIWYYNQKARQRVRLQVFRRHGHLSAAAHADRRLRTGGEQDVLRLWRHHARQQDVAAHGFVLRSQNQHRAAPTHPARQEDHRRPRQSHAQYRRGRLPLDLLQLARHLASLVHPPQCRAVFHRRLRAGQDDQLLLRSAVDCWQTDGFSFCTRSTTTPAAGQGAVLDDQPRRRAIGANPLRWPTSPRGTTR